MLNQLDPTKVVSNWSDVIERQVKIVGVVGDDKEGSSHLIGFAIFLVNLKKLCVFLVTCG